jgi:DNA-binding transcriptional MerR regulator
LDKKSERGRMNYEERHKELIELRENGFTLQEIGNLYNISRERVRQILFKFYHPNPSKRRKVSTILSAETKSRIRAREMAKKLYPTVNWYTHLVHHKDFNPLNNDPSNLQVLTHHEHCMIHWERKKVWPYINSKEVNERLQVGI